MTATRFRIVPRDVNAHLFEVSCTIDDPDAAGQIYRLPTWVPGSYLIREFARHVVSVAAQTPSGEVSVRKISKDAWQAAACTGPLTFTATIYAFDTSVRGAYLDATRGFFVGACVFVCPDGRALQPCELELVAPSHDLGQAWRVATSMPRQDAPEGGFGLYRAADYDELIDHPVEMGTFDLISFDAGSVRHDIAVSGRHHGDLERFARDLQRVCQSQIDLFGGRPGSRAPVDHYVFQLLALGEGYGGLEHRASTSLICARNNLPAPGATAVDDGYRTLLGLASHEYFHTWNVKRIKPAAFVPYDLATEAYTRQLWAFEGITSYYDDLMLLRSGVISQRDYLELVGRAISTVLRTPGRHVQSIAESSFDAWLKYYRQDENSPNAVVSYYVKGSLVALALDLVLRLDAHATLDDVMRALWQRFGQRDVGVDEDSIEAVASELAGRDLGPFFADYVSGTRELPLADLFREFGIELKLRASRDERDRGGKAIERNLPKVWLGMRMAPGNEVRVKNVLADGPAQRAGVAAGDTIVSLDGLRASPERIEHLCRTRLPGECISVLAFRRDELMSFELVLEQAPNDACWLVPDEKQTAEVLARRAAWLGG